MKSAVVDETPLLPPLSSFPPSLHRSSKEEEEEEEGMKLEETDFPCCSRENAMDSSSDSVLNSLFS